ncbi:hypothetical protein BDQ17DRAFT_1431102 [Cyathus striatus]|nr:hypothetical protein BDQ17DRAFT_1431102 [Cyathus striatus]
MSGFLPSKISYVAVVRKVLSGLPLQFTDTCITSMSPSEDQVLPQYYPPLYTIDDPVWLVFGYAPTKDEALTYAGGHNIAQEYDSEMQINRAREAMNWVIPLEHHFQQIALVYLNGDTGDQTMCHFFASNLDAKHLERSTNVELIRTF